MNTFFAHTIEEWYSKNKRVLPWRETKDPYRIWVSEIILQQTRVAQGMDYYERFVRRFPDVRSLAEAEEDEVLRLWQGLGYYSRARNMHKAARQVMEMGGVFPTTHEEVRSLAGIGDYTAAAIMSFAYDKPYAVLDGNVYRILARTQGIDTAIDSNEGRKMFAAIAQEFLDTKQPALYNQAIMDFGALQCTPKGCDCEACPLLLHCVARRENRVDMLPVKGHKTVVKARHLIYICVREENGKHTLLHRRTKGDIWEGLYEMPLIEEHLQAKLGAVDVGNAGGVTDIPDTNWLNAMMEDGGVLRCTAQQVRHVLTHRLLYADCYELMVPFDLESWLKSHHEVVKDMHFVVVDKAELSDYGMPKLVVDLMARCEMWD